MTIVYFVRHAQTDYSTSDDRERLLTETGMRDRHKVEEYFMQNGLLDKITRIYSSPYRRAIDTIQPLADCIGKPIVLVENFRERMVDATDEDYFQVNKRLWKDFNEKVQGGESLGEVTNRNIQALNHILAVHKDAIVVIGSHGTSLSTILHHYQPEFGYKDFKRVIEIKPWIVRLEFSNMEYQGYQEVLPEVK